MKQYKEIIEETREGMKYIISGSRISFPVPDRINGVLVEKVFLYPSFPSLEKTRPYAVITTAMEDGTILKYENSYVWDFVSTEKFPFENLICYALPDGEKKSVKEYLLEISLIKKLYEEIRLFVFSESLTKEQREILTKYYVIFERVVPNALLPFYQTLSDSYRKWVFEHV